MCLKALRMVNFMVAATKSRLDWIHSGRTWMVFTVNVWITCWLKGYISQVPVSVILSTLFKKYTNGKELLNMYSPNLWCIWKSNFFKACYNKCVPSEPEHSWVFCVFFFQINRAPSFGTDQKIDYDVKKGVLLNALKLLNIRYLVLFSSVQLYFCCFDLFVLFFFYLNWTQRKWKTFFPPSNFQNVCVSLAVNFAIEINLNLIFLHVYVLEKNEW